MAKCFITGVELPLESLYLLDIGTVNRKIREFQQRVRALEGLLYQLGTSDERKFYLHGKEDLITRYHRRLVCETVANVLGKTCADEKLFISWHEYTDRKQSFYQRNKKSKDDENEKDIDNNGKRQNGSCNRPQTSPD